MEIVRYTKRVGRFFGHLVKHPAIPRWLKVSLIVLLAIPGPIDEVIAVLVLVPLAIVKRDVVRECWAKS